MTHSTPNQLEIEFPQVKLCECGCEKPAPIATRTNKKWGHVAGQPVRFIRGHANRRPLLERFWVNVDEQGPEDCWEWTASTSHNGYGQLSVGSREDGTRRMVRAHRFSYELHYGPIPDGLNVCHNCPDGDRPGCVNPAHLFLGSHEENMQDMVDKQRQAVGTRNAHAKMTPEKVRRIRTLRKNGLLLKDIAVQFGVSLATISDIARGNHWRHVK